MPHWDGPFTVELVDEADMDGPVLVRDRHGNEVAQMSQEAWFHLAERE